MAVDGESATNKQSEARTATSIISETRHGAMREKSRCLNVELEELRLLVSMDTFLLND